MSAIAITNAMNMIFNGFLDFAEEVGESRGFDYETIVSLKNLWIEEKEKIEEEMKTQIKEILPSKKPRTKKPKDAPKNPKSAYVIFCQEKREEVKKTNPDIQPKEVMKELGKLWKETDEEDRKEYQEKSKEDKERYAEDMKNYVPSEEGEKEKKKKRVKKPKNAPKNVSGPYIFFCKEEREKIKQEMPELTAKEIMTELGKRWKTIKDTDEAEKYKNMSIEDKIRYAEQMENYVPSEDEENKENKKIRKPRAKKPKDAPKNGKSAYMFFCEKNRDSIKKKNSELKGKEIMTKLAEEWKKIKDTSKAKKYSKMAEEDKKRFQKEMEEYNQKKHMEISEDEDDEEEDNEEQDEDNEDESVKKQTPEDMIRDIVDNFEGESLTKKYIKEELKKKNVELSKEELNALIKKVQA
jgi:hypothetical protein